MRLRDEEWGKAVCVCVVASKCKWKNFVLVNVSFHCRTKWQRAVGSHYCWLTYKWDSTNVWVPTMSILLQLSHLTQFPLNFCSHNSLFILTFFRDELWELRGKKKIKPNKIIGGGAHEKQEMSYENWVIVAKPNIALT